MEGYPAADPESGAGTGERSGNGENNGSDRRHAMSDSRKACEWDWVLEKVSKRDCIVSEAGKGTAVAGGVHQW